MGSRLASARSGPRKLIQSRTRSGYQSSVVEFWKYQVPIQADYVPPYLARLFLVHMGVGCRAMDLDSILSDGMDQGEQSGDNVGERRR